MLQYRAVGGIVGLHSSSRGCYYFLFFQKVNGKHKVLLLGKPSPFTVGLILQAHAQLSGIKSLALPIEIPALFGKAPRVVFLSLLRALQGWTWRTRPMAPACLPARNLWRVLHSQGFSLRGWGPCVGMCALGPWASPT